MTEKFLSINHLIKPLRESLGLKQTELANQLGVNWKTVQAWEANRQAAPRYVELALCELERRAKKSRK